MESPNGATLQLIFMILRSPITLVALNLPWMHRWCSHWNREISSSYDTLVEGTPWAISIRLVFITGFPFHGSLPKQFHNTHPGKLSNKCYRTSISNRCIKQRKYVYCSPKWPIIELIELENIQNSLLKNKEKHHDIRSIISPNFLVKDLGLIDQN